MTIETTTNGRTFTANFTRSEDAGYRPGRLLLDLPGNQRHISIYRSGRQWIAALVVGGAALNHTTHATRRAALCSAADQLAAETLDAEAFSVA